MIVKYYGNIIRLYRWVFINIADWFVIQINTKFNIKLNEQIYIIKLCKQMYKTTFIHEIIKYSISFDYVFMSMHEVFINDLGERCKYGLVYKLIDVYINISY